MLSQLDSEYSNVADLDYLTNSFSQLASPSGGSNALLIGGVGAVVGAVIGAGAVAAAKSGGSGEAAAVAKPTPTKAPEVTSESKKDSDDDKDDKKESRAETTAQTRGGNFIQRGILAAQNAWANKRTALNGATRTQAANQTSNRT